MGKFYLTTTLPYVNAAPHIGFALELAQADAIAKHRKTLGEEVFFNTGTDEHGAKIARRAAEEGKTPQAFADENAAKFKELMAALGVEYTRFIRTTDPDHVAAAQEFWRRCAAKGDIYLAKYRIKYCVGCELEKTESELVNGRCPVHPNLEIEEREEENYFFRFSRYKEALLALYEKYPDFVLPAHRLTEIRRFVETGPQDFSISRLKEKMAWGIPVPGDDKHVMYVWFDALINYVSTLDWPGNEEKFREFWGTQEEPRAIQMAGKDNLRQQSAMWQAMLMSAGLPTSRRILIHGFITSGGEKMSKSLGNVVDPFEIIGKYGSDALRFWLLRDVPTFADGDFTWDKFKESYNANLANGLGNLVSRVMRMAVTGGHFPDMPDGEAVPDWAGIEDFEIKRTMDSIWAEIQDMDAYIQLKEPFRLAKSEPQKAGRIISELVFRLYRLGLALRPFLPEAAEKILAAVRSREMPAPIFPRIT